MGLYYVTKNVSIDYLEKDQSTGTDLERMRKTLYLGTGLPPGRFSGNGV